MKITVKHEKHRFFFVFPNLFFLNAWVVNRMFKDKRRPDHEDAAVTFHLSGKDMRRIRKIIRKTRRAHPDWCLVDVKSSSGETVKVKL